MHVAIVTPAYSPLPGGGERYAAALARGLAACGVRVTVVTSAATTEANLWHGAAAVAPEDDGAIRVIRLPIRPFPGGRRGLMLWRKAMVLLSAAPGDATAGLMRMARRVPPIVGLDETLDGLRVDLIHGFNVSWEHGLVAAYEAMRRRGIPLAVTPFAHLGEKLNDRVARNSTMEHQRQIMHAARRVMVLTRVEAEGLAHYGVAAGRISVIGGGTDAPPDDVSASPYWQGSGRDWPEPYALFIGRLSFDKGAIHAVEAVQRLQQHGRGLSLILVGSMTPEFERFYRRLGPEARERIRPLGVLSERDKHAILAHARFLMLPSRSDSFGIVLLEAWSHGVPVVAARAGGIPGVVDEGANGLLAPFGDVDALAEAAGQLLAKPELAHRLGENGRDKIAVEYSWGVVAERVAAHYRAILADQP